MKLLCTLLLCLSFTAHASEAQDIDQLKLSTQEKKIEQLVETIRSLKASESLTKGLTHRDHCDDDDNNSQMTCVSQCSVRSSSGSCLSYNSDYCGVDASCSENCSVRSSSGSCLSYDSDYCGPNAFCSPNCTVRSSSGSCLSYGSDICY